MNRLAGIVAGTASAGGEDKWYQGSARLLSYNVLKSGVTGQREQDTYLYGAEDYAEHLPAEAAEFLLAHAPDVHQFALDEEKVCELPHVPAVTTATAEEAPCHGVDGVSHRDDRGGGGDRPRLVGVCDGRAGFAIRLERRAGR
jgi:hypothetical protein